MCCLVGQHHLKPGHPPMLTRFPPPLVNQPRSCPVDDGSAVATKAHFVWLRGQLTSACHADGPTCADHIDRERLSVKHRRRRSWNVPWPWSVGTWGTSRSVTGEIDKRKRHLPDLFDRPPGSSSLRNRHRRSAEQPLNSCERTLCSFSGLRLPSPETELTARVGNHLIRNQTKYRDASRRTVT